MINVTCQKDHRDYIRDYSGICVAIFSVPIASVKFILTNIVTNLSLMYIVLVINGLAVMNAFTGFYGCGQTCINNF